MKNQRRVVFIGGTIAIFLFFSLTGRGQTAYDDQYYGQTDNPVSNYTGLPGDDFSLEGALELFRQSSSPEGFEKALNDERNDVNNLDLDGDGLIDYVRVLDRTKGTLHAVVIQAIVGRGDYQDIAVIEIERKNRDEVAIQIVGDEDMYGGNVIIEPKRPEYNDSWYGYNNQYNYAGNSNYGRGRGIYNAWDWPVIRYIYSPTYVVWVSPWAYRSYPGWYRSWHPYHWNDFSSRCQRYNPHFVIIYHPVVFHAREWYQPYRTTSKTVHVKYATQISTYRSQRTAVVVKTGNYRVYERSNNTAANVAAKDNRPQRTSAAPVSRATTTSPARSATTTRTNAPQRSPRVSEDGAQNPNTGIMNRPSRSAPTNTSVDVPVSRATTPASDIEKKRSTSVQGSLNAPSSSRRPQPAVRERATSSRELAPRNSSTSTQRAHNKPSARNESANGRRSSDRPSRK